MKVLKVTGILIVLLTLGRTTLCSGQELVEVSAENESLRIMDQGVELMNQGEFAKADKYFLRVLESVDIVPADLCFYFGKNSYHLQKYKQSMDWLSKYMELKGTTGRFFDQAVEYLKLAKEDFAAATKQTSVATQSKTDTKPRTVDCSENPYVRCPVCQGEGVIVEPGKLGSLVYKTCPFSDDSGRMTCDDYYKYLRGELRLSATEERQ